MNILIGTSGWVYKDWAKVFYPTTLKNEYKLTYFAHHFKTVEVNSTFYKLPSETAVKNWYGSVPADFVFTIKLSRYLTHMVQLKPGDKFNQGLNNYFSRLQYLGNKIGVVLVQLPPSFHAALEKIDNLVAQFKIMESRYNLSLPIALEVRHDSWFTAEVFDLLRSYNIANVIGSGPGRWAESREVTSSFGFIRFHGSERLYASSYSDQELDEWANFIKTKYDPASTIYIYFNNDKSARAVDNAKYLAAQLSNV